MEKFLGERELHKLGKLNGLRFPDLDALSRYAAELFVFSSRKSIRDKGFFSVALSGGSTPQKFYHILGQREFASHIDWHRVHIFLSDERAVPPDHVQSNYRMVFKTLISKIDIPWENVHRVKTEIENLDVAAMEYEGEIRCTLRERKKSIPSFDLLFLGLGEDGHTASLFPYSAAIQEKKKLVAANYIGTLGQWRLTFTYPLINQSAHVVIMVSGREKKKILSRSLGLGMRRKILDRKQIPVNRVAPKRGKLTWLVDRNAIPRLHNN